MTAATSRSPFAHAIVVLGILLATGFVTGAFVLGKQVKNIGSGRSSVIVKGLAEKQIKADLAEWQISAVASGSTFGVALAALRKEKEALDRFLEAQGFAAPARVEGNENVEPRYVEKEVGERIVHVQEGFVGRQTILVTDRALDRIARAHKAVLDYKASGHEVDYANPSYFVSGLEDIKMSLIAAATENAKRRAGEFVKSGEARLGAMRSASQGAFYILADSTDARGDDYGGVYDKSTVDKIARVVVTVEFNLLQ